ncbi:MAG: DUF2849 domain-containing protein [Brevundimonas sp.]
MKLITGSRLGDGHVVYLAVDGALTTRLDQAAALEADAADTALALAASRHPALVNPYLIEVADGRPSGRDRLKESIRAAGPTVGHSLDAR